MIQNTTLSHKIPKKKNIGVFQTLKGIIQFIQDPLLSFEESIAEIGDTFRVGFGKNTFYITLNPNHVQHVLQENHKNYTKSAKYDHLKLFLGNGLLTSEGEFWLQQRRTIQPAFHKQKLLSIFETMQSCSQNVVDRWKKYSHTDEIDVSEEMIQSTLTIAGKTLFSVDLENSASDAGRAINNCNTFINQRIRRPFNFPAKFPLPSHIRFKKDIQKIDLLIYQIIQKRNQQNANDFHDVLSLLLDAKDEDTGKSMNEQQLRDELVTLFIAGYETTAVSMSWIIYLLAKYPDYQEKIREEIQQVTNNQQVNYQNFSQLKWTKAIIDESLRLYPPAWIIGRKSIKEDFLGEYFIPENTNVALIPYFIHRHPNLWENPNQFFPERFLNGSSLKHKFSYIPFGSGPRLCIGMQFAIMEMVLLLSDLVRNFHWKLIDNHQDVKPLPLVTLKPNPYVKINIQSR